MVIAGNRIDYYLSHSREINLEVRNGFKSIIKTLDFFLNTFSYKIVRFGFVCRWIEDKKEPLSILKELIRSQIEHSIEDTVR